MKSGGKHGADPTRARTRIKWALILAMIGAFGTNVVNAVWNIWDWGAISGWLRDDNEPDCSSPNLLLKELEECRKLERR